MSQPPVAVYTPDSQLTRPLQLVRGMLRDLLCSRELAWRLFVRNISAQYRQTILGYAWAFLPPIFTTLTFVFLNRENILHTTDTAVPYAAYVMVGTVLWQTFFDAMNSPLKLVATSKRMLAQVNFPREALIIAGIGEVLFNFVIRLSLVVAVLLWYAIEVPWTAALAPLGVLALVGLGLMLGILLVPIAVLYQDIERGLVIFLTLLFFLTPVVYTPPTEGAAAWMAQVNPVSPLLVTTRELLLDSSVSYPGAFFLVTAITFALLLVGWLVYRLAMPFLVERIGA